MESVPAITQQELDRKLDAKDFQFVESKTNSDPCNNNVDYQQQRQRRRDVHASAIEPRPTQTDLVTIRGDNDLLNDDDGF